MPVRLIAWFGAVILLTCSALAEMTPPEKDALEVLGSQARWAVIPAAANAPGRFGAHYKTRVVLFNPTPDDFSVTAVLSGPNGPVRRLSIPIGSGEYLVFDNFLEEVFEYRGGGAVVLIAPSEAHRFYTTAEVYTESPSGRFSTTVVNGIIPVYSRGREPEYNLGISVGQDRRTNIGVLNGEDKPSRVEAKVFDGSGTLVETIGFELKPEAWQQKSISAPIEDGYVQWETRGESETHYFYAVEVDNTSNDGTLTYSTKALISR